MRLRPWSDRYEKSESAQFPLSRARGAVLLRLLLAERGENAGHLAKLLATVAALLSVVLLRSTTVTLTAR